ncbi:MAG: ATP-binding protein [Lachnospiraceae bacterium]|nr:ATP-binding protein [Lachnospiraceae bacterium]
MALPTWQYDELMRAYDQRRQQNQDLHRRRLSEVYAKIPAIKQLDEEISSHSIAIGRKMLFDSDESALKELRDKNLELSMAKVEYLVQNGYAPDYLDPIYTCRACKDTGYIGNKKCSCLKQAIVNQLYKQSNIYEKLIEENFQTFSYEYYSEEQLYPNRPSPRRNIVSIVERCMDFISTFKSNPGQNILFQGSVGVGKSFLTNCIAKELLDESCTVIYLTAFELVEVFENHRFHRSSDGESSYSMDYILNCDLLIIDDLGTEMTNSFVASELFLCLNERLLRKKSVIISTNLSLSQLKDNYTERVISRIAENYLICNIYGEDIRMKKSFK